MNAGLRPGVFWGLIALLTLGLFGLGAPLAGQGQELLVNGGFEDPLDPPWYFTPNIKAQQVTEPRFDGSYGLKLTVTDGRVGEVWQVVSRAPGAGTYEVSAWVMGGENVGAIRIITEWYPSADATGPIIRDYRLVYTGTAGLLAGQALVDGQATSARVRVQLQPAAAGPTATMFVDGVSLKFLAAAATNSPTPTHPAAPSQTPAPGPGEPTPSPTPPHYGPGSLVINEFLYDAGISGCGTACEWVELVNPTGSPIDLRNWTLADNGRSDPLPGAIIPAGGVAIIAATAGALTFQADGTFVLVVMPTGRIGNGLSNEGDRLVLRAPDGTVVAALSYGADDAYPPALPLVRPGWSLERLPATTGPFRPNPQPSAGRLSPVCCLSWLPAVIGRR